ncbi:hypothetical protein [Solibacillus sp. FSL H8-0538]|uniref:hypothetical protein n=1 Tax=Solibacillus sp. FSL H8-0538 TaxID=2921400 RepID=UPI0030F7E718
METRGRKPSIYPQAEIENIIYLFTQKEKVTGWIKYSEVYRFANKLYEERVINYKLSEDYWRRDGRQGKEIIDKTNKLYENTIINKNDKSHGVYVDTEECVNKFFSGKPSDKKRLIEALKINEKKAKESNNLLVKIDTMKEELSVHHEKNKELQALVKQQQMILFSWFNASLKTDVPLTNLITTGKSRQPIVDLFFETAFSNPMEGYEKFEEYRKKNTIDENSKKDTIVTPIRKSRLQQITDNFRDDK